MSEVLYYESERVLVWQVQKLEIICYFILVSPTVIDNLSEQRIDLSVASFVEFGIYYNDMVCIAETL